LALQLLGNLALETRAIGLRDPEYADRLARIQRQVFTQPARPLWVALGSSRTQMGLCPSAMIRDGNDSTHDPLVMNFGLAGAGPVQQLLTFERLIADGVRPSRMLIEVLPAFFHNDNPPEKLVAVSRLSYRDLGRLSGYWHDESTVRRDWWLRRLSPFSMVRFVLVSRLVPGWLPFRDRQDYLWMGVDAFGWYAYPQATIEDTERESRTLKALADYAPNWHDYQISPGPDRALRTLLDRCQALNIPVTLYRMPESPRFRRTPPPEFAVCSHKYLNTMMAEYHIDLIDAQDWIADDRAFVDGHHLLSGSAREFSVHLADRLRAIGTSAPN